MRVETHLASTLAIGRIMGAETRAQELARLYAGKVAEVKARVAKGRDRRPKVYVELGQRGPSEYGNSYGADLWGPLVETSGGANIARGKINAPAPLSAEYVLASNPDYVFITGSNWTNSPDAVEMGFGVPSKLTNERLRRYLDRPGWRNLTAVREGHVYAIHHGIARTLFDFVGMQFFAKALYPAQFADVDPEASMRDYFRKYLPVTYEGTWMWRLQP
jgi:iron complex transport system substrate-binding protein